MVLLVAGLGFEPRIAKAYETLPVTGPFPRYFIYLYVYYITTLICCQHKLNKLIMSLSCV